MEVPNMLTDLIINIRSRITRRSIACIILCSVFLLKLASCGSGGDCSGSFNGVWSGTTQADEVILTSTCGFVYTGVSSTCQSIGTYAKPLGSSGSMIVTVTSLTGSGACYSIGDLACDYVLNEAYSTFSYNCGDGTVSYEK